MRVSHEVCNLGVTKPLNIQTMHFTKVQISELMRKHAEKENGLHDLMEIMLESMMVAERVSFCMKILKIRAMAIVLDMPMAKEENWNSVFPATVMATFIPGYLPFFAIRKRNVTSGRSLIYQRTYAGTGRRCL